MSPRLFALFVDNTYKQGTNCTTYILWGCRKQGTLPEPRLYKRGLLRLRMNGQGSRQADEGFKAILAA